MNELQYGIATSRQDMEQILALQRANLPAGLSEEEAVKEGFVTVEHDLATLEMISGRYGHVVARAGGEVVGYALVMLAEYGKSIAILEPLFEAIELLEYGGERVGEQRYVVMGQICIAKGWRGRGLFRGLYEELERRMKPHFDYLITEVAHRNQRSLRAHLRLGFVNVRDHADEKGALWETLLRPI